MYCELLTELWLCYNLMTRQPVFITGRSIKQRLDLDFVSLNTDHPISPPRSIKYTEICISNSPWPWPMACWVWFSSICFFVFQGLPSRRNKSALTAPAAGINHRHQRLTSLLRKQTAGRQSGEVTAASLSQEARAASYRSRRGEITMSNAWTITQNLTIGGLTNPVNNNLCRMFTGTTVTWNLPASCLDPVNGAKHGSRPTKLHGPSFQAYLLCTLQVRWICKPHCS
jgi:hypothetical protein